MYLLLFPVGRSFPTKSSPIPPLPIFASCMANGAEETEGDFELPECSFSQRPMSAVSVAAGEGGEGQRATHIRSDVQMISARGSH